MCVNEGAAQICKFIPALLTRRDELFPLARQLVKDAGFGHSASIARYGIQQQLPKTDDGDPNSAKRSRLSSTDALTTDYNKVPSKTNKFSQSQTDQIINLDD